MTISSRNEDRMRRGRALYLAVYETRGVSWEANECKELWCEKADRYLELAATTLSPTSRLPPAL